jgi:hypothetical protein
MRFALLSPGYKDRKGELIPIEDFCVELLERSNIPSVQENDPAFVQGEILLEEAFPWTLMVGLESDEHIPQGRRLQVQSNRSLQSKFSSEYVCDDGHG